MTGRERIAVIFSAALNIDFRVEDMEFAWTAEEQARFDRDTWQHLTANYLDGDSVETLLARVWSDIPALFPHDIDRERAEGASDCRGSHQ